MLQLFKDKPWIIYAASILGCIGSWIYGLPNWHQATSTAAIGSLLGSISSATLAAAGASILKSINSGAGSPPSLSNKGDQKP